MTSLMQMIFRRGLCSAISSFSCTYSWMSANMANETEMASKADTHTWANSGLLEVSQ